MTRWSARSRACSRSSTTSTRTSTPRCAQGRGRRVGEPVGQQTRRRRRREPGADDGEGAGGHQTVTSCARRAATSDSWVGASGTCAGLRAANSLAQHRHDLLAEDVQLLEHRLERQPRVVDEEQLALVVADVLAEAQRPVDDLLRAADGQRRLAGEVLQRRPVPVHRGLVEVRAELAHRVLRVLPHEHLAAEADDRLVGVAVAVVLEAAAVEVDHAPGVVGGPEDVVVEEAVAVEGGLLGDLGAADRAVPHERRDAVERARGRGEALQRRAELPLPVDDVLVPQTAQQRVVLHRQRDALADVLAEPGIDGAGVAAPEREVDAAAGDVLQHRVVLGDLHRVVRGDQRRRGGELQALRAAGQVAERRRRRGRHERRVVVLAEGEDVEADLLGLLRDAQDGLETLGLGGGEARRRVGGDVADREDTELHGPALL